jgi:hypothetical protein
MLHIESGHGDLGFGNAVHGRFRLRLRLHRQRAAMAGNDGAGEVGAERCVGNGVEGAGGGIAGLVDVKVEIEAAVGGAVHDQLERAVEVGDHEGNGAEDAAVPGNRVDDIVGISLVEELVDGEDRYALSSMRPPSSRISANTGHEILCRGAVESMWCGKAVRA